MKKLRILSLMLALLTLLGTFVACKGDETPPPTEPVTTLQVVNDSVSDYVLVYDYQADDEVITMINYITAQMKEFLGVDIETRACYSNIEDEENDVEVEKEILVGVTNRKESIEAMKGLRSSDYVIGVYGAKVVIGGPTGNSTKDALSLFLTDYIQKQGDKFVVSDGGTMDFTLSSDKNLRHIATTYSYDKCVIMGARIDSYALIYGNTDGNVSGNRELADLLSTHISKQAGYELKILKDTSYWADYQILIGNTVYSDQAIAEELEDNEYYISLKKVEVTYEDGSKHEGAVIQILFGKDAMNDAFNAFKANFIKTSTTALSLEMNEEKVVTNMAG